MTTLLPRTEAAGDRAGPRPHWGWIAAGGLAAAGGLHVAAAADHLDAGDVVAGFFLVVAAAQLGAGAWLAVGSVTRIGRPPRPVAAVLAATVGLVLLYLVVHTTDLLAGVVGADHHGATGSATHGAAHDGSSGPAGPVALGLAPAEAGSTPGLLGTVTVAVELVTVLALTALLPATHRRRAANSLLALGALAWVAWFTGVLA